MAIKDGNKEVKQEEEIVGEDAKKYQTTKEQCQNSIWGFCDGCGQRPEPIETVDNAKNPTFWVGCMQCSTFCRQVSKEDFVIAKALVMDFGYYPYNSIKKPDPIMSGAYGLNDIKNEEWDYFYKNQIRGAYPLIRFFRQLTESKPMTELKPITTTPNTEPLEKYLAEMQAEKNYEWKVGDPVWPPDNKKTEEGNNDRRN